MKKTTLFPAFILNSYILTTQEKKEEIKPMPEAKSFISMHQINIG